MGTISNRAKVGNPLPFDAIPREMATDPRLDRAKKDYFVAGRLLFYARWDDHTTVADDTIATEAGIGIATVKRSLKRLEAAGWIRRRQVRKTRENATGRVIVLCWKLPDFEESRKSPADDISAGRTSGGVAHPCANESLKRERLESLTRARQHRVVVVEGGEKNTTPQTPLSIDDNDNDNDPDPGPAVIPIADEDLGARALVEDLGGAMADPVEAAEPFDADAEAERPVPSVYPMAGCEGLEHVPPDWAEAMLLHSRSVDVGAECRNFRDLPTPPPVSTTLSRRDDTSETKIISDSPSASATPPESLKFRDLPAPPPSAYDPARDYSPSQMEWWAGLTEPQRDRFRELSPRRRYTLIEPHRHGRCDDPVLMRETAAALAPRTAFAAERAMPTTLEGMWEGLPGGPASWPQLAAEMMVRRFGGDRDRKLWPAFHALALAVWRGQLSPEAVLDALRQASKPGVRNPGAVFNTALQRDCGWRWS